MSFRRPLDGIKVFIPNYLIFLFLFFIKIYRNVFSFYLFIYSWPVMEYTSKISSRITSFSKFKCMKNNLIIKDIVYLLNCNENSHSTSTPLHYFSLLKNSILLIYILYDDSQIKKTTTTMIKNGMKFRKIQQRMKMKMNNNNKPTIHTIEHTPTHSKTHSRFSAPFQKS